jgi:pimeloyl-ACP methyl ester carboxylesterase
VDRLRHMKIGSVDVAYIRRGTGAPLLLLHGGEADHHNFDGFAQLLSPSIHTIAYDQRDCGESVDLSDQDYTLKDLAKDAAELIVSLGFDRVHVMGSSAGGLVAQLVALNFPERVDRLILNVTAPVNEGVSKCNPGILERLARLRANEDHQGLAEVFSTPAYVAEHPEMIETLRSLRSAWTLPPDKRARRMKAVTTFPTDADLSTISHKTLVIAGEYDQIVTLEIAKRLVSRIPNAALKVIPAAGHTALVENKELYSRIVIDFLQSTSKGAR